MSRSSTSGPDAVVVLALLLRGFDWHPPDDMGPEDFDMREASGVPMPMVVPFHNVPIA